MKNTSNITYILLSKIYIFVIVTTMSVKYTLKSKKIYLENS